MYGTIAILGTGDHHMGNDRGPESGGSILRNVGQIWQKHCCACQTRPLSLAGTDVAFFTLLCHMDPKALHEASI